MSSHSGMWKKTVFTYGIILLGSGILSFGLYNIHERTNVTEGGVLGMTLLLQHWFGFSPSVTSPLMDIACYLLAWRFLGNAFARYALADKLRRLGSVLSQEHTAEGVVLRWRAEKANVDFALREGAVLLEAERK